MPLILKKGVGDEPTVQQVIAGVDMVTFSGDKLLGSPRRHYCGKDKYIAQMKIPYQSIAYR